jgi:hypothetical protein
MDETSFDAPRQDRDRSSRFGEVLQRAYAEDGRTLPDEITRLMLDLSRVDGQPAAHAARAQDNRAVPASSAAPPGRWSPAGLIGRLRNRG